MSDRAFELLSEQDKQRLVTRDRTPRTSLNDPLRVDYVAAEKLPGVTGLLGMTFAPGKKDPNGWLGHYDRDLPTDLAAIHATGGRVLVTLMEQHELQRFQIATLRKDAESLGIRSIWFPVRDVDVPTSMSGHHSLVEEVRAELSEGRSVVVHCKGGLGRTGVLVASVLVTFGHSPEEAIAITRATRSGTIQTYAQERFVHQYSAYLQRQTTSAGG